MSSSSLLLVQIVAFIRRRLPAHVNIKELADCDQAIALAMDNERVLLRFVVWMLESFALPNNHLTLQELTLRATHLATLLINDERPGLEKWRLKEGPQAGAVLQSLWVAVRGAITQWGDVKTFLLPVEVDAEELGLDDAGELEAQRADQGLPWTDDPRAAHHVATKNQIEKLVREEAQRWRRDVLVLKCVSLAVQALCPAFTLPLVTMPTAQAQEPSAQDLIAQLLEAWAEFYAPEAGAIAFFSLLKGDSPDSTAFDEATRNGGEGLLDEWGQEADLVATEVKWKRYSGMAIVLHQLLTGGE